MGQQPVWRVPGSGPDIPRGSGMKICIQEMDKMYSIRRNYLNFKQNRRLKLAMTGASRASPPRSP